MMYDEFEKIAGYEVSYETYTDIIEPMYMALPDNVSKQQFVKMLDKKAFALPTKKEMLKEMKKIANYIFENCGRTTFIEEEKKLNKIAKEYAKRFFGIDWTNDIESYVFCNTKYGYCGYVMERGCSFPYELVIGRKNTDYERITLVNC